MSSLWFWSVLMGLAIDSMFDVAIAVAEAILYRYARSIAMFIYMVRSVKQAGLQE